MALPIISLAFSQPRLPWSINTHLSKSYTGYAMLLMSWFWRICFALGLIPSKIINQSGTVINISV